jgi:hypothetical protein
MKVVACVEAAVTFASAIASRRPSIPPSRRRSSTISTTPLARAAIELPSASLRKPMTRTSVTLTMMLATIVATLTATGTRLCRSA